MKKPWSKAWLDEMKEGALRAEREAYRPCRIHALVLMGIVFAVFAITLWAGLSVYEWPTDGGGGGTYDHNSDTVKP
jgi:hypothetical protein